MKSYIIFPAIFLTLVACTDKSAKFAGTWQQTDDASKQITITQTGKTFTFETNLESPFEGVPGTYNSDKKSLDFDNGAGTTVSFLFNDISQHILALGHEFEKSSATAADDAPVEEQGPEEAVAEQTSDDATSETVQSPEKTTTCGKGNAYSITGNNVRVRAEPDLTKQNILFQVHKGYEVVQLDEKTVDGQKWYKVCYDGNMGWVSGQYATKK